MHMQFFLMFVDSFLSMVSTETLSLFSLSFGVSSTRILPLRVLFQKHTGNKIARKVGY